MRVAKLLNLRSNLRVIQRAKPVQITRAMHTTIICKNIWNSVKQDKEDTVSQILPPNNYLKDLIKTNRLSCSPDDVEAMYRLANESIQRTLADTPRSKDELVKDQQDTDKQILSLAGENVKTVNRLAMMAALFTTPDGKRPGLDIAMRLFDVSTSHGSLDAEYEVAKLLYSGILNEQVDGEVDTKQIALLKLRELAAKGHHLSMYTLASELGRSAEVSDVKQGVDMLKKIAEEGNFASAFVQLAFLHQVEGKDAERLRRAGIEFDPVKTKSYLEKTIASGQEEGPHQQAVAQAHYLLGILHMNGDPRTDTPRNVFTAMQCFQKAASIGGLAVAQHNVGSLYLEGIPDPDKPGKFQVEKSNAMAKQYFEMASMQQFQPSLLNLAKMALEEEPKQVAKARQYLERAMQLGGPFGEEAKQWLAQLPPSDESTSQNASESGWWPFKK